MTVRTRFAPSPTGFLHIGGARTALFSWLYARKHGGEFVLRIEDTDRERSTEESVDAILESMAWLGLDYDQGPFFQSRRFDRYREVQERMLSEGLAYRCFCSKERIDAIREAALKRKEKPRYDGHCRDRTDPPPEGVAPVIRFKNPLEGEVVVEDLIRGRLVFQNAELDDLILARPDGTPTYNFTVVVDDFEMSITHVIRGDDHINNTPRQMNILTALGTQPPVYAHVPMILGDDGQRLSKRHGAVSVMQYHEDGYLPEALINHLARLGWSHGDQEIFSLDELIALFDITDVNRAASSFNLEKLNWLNQHYIKTGEAAHVARYLSGYLGRLGVDPTDGPDLTDVVVAYRERAKTLTEMAQSCVYLYRDFENYEQKAAAKNLKPEALDLLSTVRERMAELASWTASSIHEVITGTAEQAGLKLGKLAQPLRVAVSGGAVTPPIDVVVELLGRERTLARVDRAIQHIRAQGVSSS